MVERRPGNRVGVCWIALAAAAACGGEPDPEPVLAKASVGPLVFASSFYGELEARTSLPMHTPDLSGINYLTVKTVLPDGSRVDKGDVVLTFEKGPIEDALVEEQAKLAVAQAQMRRVSEGLAMERIDLELNVRRSEMAVERAELNVVVGVNLISKLELEKAKLDLQRAKLDLQLARRSLRSFADKRKSSLEVERLKVAAIEEKLAQRRKAMKAMRLRAPASGVIYGPHTRLNWVRGKVAPGSVTRPGDKLLELPELTAFNAVIYVRQRDATLLHVGDVARIIVTVRPDRPVEARILAKETFATTRNQRFGTEEPAGNLKEIKVTLEIGQTLPEFRPGGSLRADVASRLAANVLMVPLAALHRVGKKHWVLLRSGERRQVSLGKASTTHVEIKSGLKAGQQVVLAGAARFGLDD